MRHIGHGHGEQESYAAEHAFHWEWKMGLRLIAQVVVPIWILALYHAVAYAGAKFGGTQLWQQYGARLQQALSAYQVKPAAVPPL